MRVITASLITTVPPFLQFGMKTVLLQTPTRLIFAPFKIPLKLSSRILRPLRLMTLFQVNSKSLLHAFLCIAVIEIGSLKPSNMSEMPLVRTNGARQCETLSMSTNFRRREPTSLLRCSLIGFAGTRTITPVSTHFLPSVNLPFSEVLPTLFAATVANVSQSPLIVYLTLPFPIDTSLQSFSITDILSRRTQTITKLLPMSSCVWRNFRRRMIWSMSELIRVREFQFLSSFPKPRLT